MNFITIDFETATSQRDSPCEIGLTFVEDWKVKETRSWLIKPKYDEFDPFNIRVHGIRPDHVFNEPTFDLLWKEILPLIEGKFLIAHNAGYDMSVLRKTLEHYSVDFPTLDYSCSYIFSKKVWPGQPSYNLESLCAANQISYKPHRAGEDSRATAELSIKALTLAQVSEVSHFPEKLKTTIGKLFPGGYIPAETKRENKSWFRPKVEIESRPELHDPESAFYEKTVVFTGELLSMSRPEAMQRIADIGGVPKDHMTKATDYLVVGLQDYRVVGAEGMSSKQRKAIEMVEKGSEIEILSEEEFLKMLS